MAYPLAAAAADVVDQLAAAGLAATIDPRDLNPPGVWVQLANVRPAYLATGAAYDADWYLYLIAPNIGTGQEFAVISPLADQLLAAGWALADGQTIAVTLPDGADPYPSLRFTLTTHCTED